MSKYIDEQLPKGHADIVLCVGCRFLKEPDGVRQCTKPDNMAISLVDGKQYATFDPAFLRADSSRCGRAAVWREANEGGE